jgi:hypothetical protein
MKNIVGQIREQVSKTIRRLLSKNTIEQKQNNILTDVLVCFKDPQEEEEEEEEEFLFQWNDALKNIDEEFHLTCDDEKKKEKICNLCKHYLLLNQRCVKKGEPKAPNETCKEWLDGCICGKTKK